VSFSFGGESIFMIREDISNKLVHLTRGDTDQAAAEKFISIVEGRKLLGGTACIKGSYHCVCFSEAPLSKLTYILANPTANGMRYKPFGVMIDKSWLFTRGGRPVIYQPDSDFELLHDLQKYRHVRYEHGTVDFTWEREWRIATTELEIDPSAATLVVPNRAWKKWALNRHTSMLSLRALALNGMIGPRSVTEFPWHFVVLEDLGVEVPSVSPPK